MNTYYTKLHFIEQGLLSLLAKVPALSCRLERVPYDRAFGALMGGCAPYDRAFGAPYRLQKV